MRSVEKRRMCPNCRAFISVDDKVCPYCDTRLSAPAIERREGTDALGGLIPSARFTTVVLLLVNFGLYAACTLYSMRGGAEGLVTNIDGQTLYQFGAKETRSILNGQWWRLITAGYLHGGILHILMNSWIIFDLGAQVEEVFGTPRYLVIYTIATIGGFLASMFWSPALSVGASAGLFGLIGAMIVAGMRTKTPMGSAIRAHYTQWAIWGLAIGLMGFRTDNAAHLGGLAAGFVVAWIAGEPKLYQNWTETLWRAAAIFCVILTLGCFALMFLRFSVVG
jgi:rhomboid protease GluP